MNSVDLLRTAQHHSDLAVRALAAWDADPTEETLHGVSVTAKAAADAWRRYECLVSTRLRRADH